MRKTVIFDMDGTLLDTLEDLYLSVNRAMDAFGFPPRSKDHVRRSVGNGIYQLMRSCIPQGEDNPHYAECVEFYRREYSAHMNDHTAPYPGISELLEKLKKEEYRLAIVSNKPDAAVKGLSRKFFQEQISVAIGESSKIARKPAGDTVFAAMKELGVPREDCIYVGDSEVDAQTAGNCGIPCILVTWGFRSREVLERQNVWKIVDTAEELREELSLQ